MAGGGDMLTDGKGTGLGACGRIVVATLQVGEARGEGKERGRKGEGREKKREEKNKRN